MCNHCKNTRKFQSRTYNLSLFLERKLSYSLMQSFSRFPLSRGDTFYRSFKCTMVA
uniref:Uncharacterized protein n=1 Tax=Arundo donax TaxID=35708 RepID=A0A0A9DJ78_ARUDO